MPGMPPRSVRQSATRDAFRSTEVDRAADLQALHRIRSRLIANRTQLANQIRGLLAEYGIVLPLHLSQVRQQLPALFSEDHPLLTSFGRGLLASLYEELCVLDGRIEAMEGG
jgi:transposase